MAFQPLYRPRFETTIQSCNSSPLYLAVLHPAASHRSARISGGMQPQKRDTPCYRFCPCLDSVLQPIPGRCPERLLPRQEHTFFYKVSAMCFASIGMSSIASSQNFLYLSIPKYSI